MESITIKADELIKIMSVISEKITVSIGNSIAIARDYYWDIPMDEAFKLEKDVSPSVGSLFDDWENLLKMLTDDQLPAFINLDRLASVLKAISYELNPPATSTATSTNIS